MGADKGKKQKVGGADEENNGTEQIDGELVLSIEKLQEIQDELEKVNSISCWFCYNWGKFQAWFSYSLLVLLIIRVP